MIRVYFWLPNDADVGHSSAQIGCTNEGYAAYVSWWPSVPVNSPKPVSGRANSFATDVAIEKRNADVTFDIEGLDEVAASSWWSSFLATSTSDYNLRSNNCSWAVVAALKAGGSDAFFPWHQFFEKSNIPTTNLPGLIDGSALPSIISKYGQHVIRLYLEGHYFRFSIKRPLIEIADDYLSVWSPKDALAYCSVLENNIRRVKAGGKLWIPEFDRKLMVPFGRRG